MRGGEGGVPVGGVGWGTGGGGDDDEKQSERSALLDGEPNGTKQGPAGNELGWGLCVSFRFRGGSIWNQPMRGDAPDYIVNISELKVHLKPRAERRGER